MSSSLDHLAIDLICIEKLYSVKGPIISISHLRCYIFFKTYFIYASVKQFKQFYRNLLESLFFGVICGKTFHKYVAPSDNPMVFVFLGHT